MSRLLPVVFVWQEVHLPETGEVISAMVPAGNYGKLAKRQFERGAEYPMVVEQNRSMNSHRHYFASLHDVFMNLPEDIAPRYPTEDHFRSWCLIETGWFDEKDFDCDTETMAKRLAAFIRTEDSYARISIHKMQRGWKVIVRRAKSQAIDSMGGSNFEKSKRDVLDLASSMIGVSPTELKRNAGRAS